MIQVDESFVDEALERAIPLAVQWDLTWRCDHKCVHCYLTDRHQPELTLEEAERVLDELAAAGSMLILFSGGDLFLRPDALAIIAAARARRFDVKLNTHGNFIDDAVADELARLRVQQVGISLYSDLAEEHEAVTLIPGSHAKTIAAGRRLRERGVSVSFKTPLTVYNRKSWHRVEAIAEELGAKWEVDSSLIPDDQSDFGLCKIGIDPTERVLANLKMLDDRRAVQVPFDEIPATPSKRRVCSAGTASAYITPDGRVFPCLTWREEMGSLREASFSEIWNESPAAPGIRAVRRASFLKGGCDGCQFHGHCSYCPGISHAESQGDPTKRSAYICERTHLTLSSMEHMLRLIEKDAPVPLPGSPEAEALLNGPPTMADRQWAARKAGWSQPSDRLHGGLIQIGEPRPR